MLSENRFGDARVAADAVIERLLDDSRTPVDELRAALTEAVVCRAVGESRGMQNDLALRDWYVAANLDPKLAGALRDRLDVAGIFPTPEALFAPSPAIHHVRPADPSVTPPRIVKRTDLLYPKRARRLRLEMNVIVEAVIDVTGRVTQPRVLTNDADPSLVYSSIQAVSAWMFEPSRAAGNPVPVKYNLTITFKLEPEK
jgi:TonB family protein